MMNGSKGVGNWSLDWVMILWYVDTPQYVFYISLLFFTFIKIWYDFFLKINCVFVVCCGCYSNSTWVQYYQRYRSQYNSGVCLIVKLETWYSLILVCNVFTSWCCFFFIINKCLIYRRVLVKIWASDTKVDCLKHLIFLLSPAWFF